MNVASLLSDGPPPSARTTTASPSLSSSSVTAAAPGTGRPSSPSPPTSSSAQQQQQLPRDYAYQSQQQAARHHPAAQQHQRRPSSPHAMPPPGGGSGPSRASKSPTISTLTNPGGPTSPSLPLSSSSASAAAGNNSAPGYSSSHPSSSTDYPTHPADRERQSSSSSLNNNASSSIAALPQGQTVQLLNTPNPNTGPGGSHSSSGHSHSLQAAAVGPSQASSNSSSNPSGARGRAESNSRHANPNVIANEQLGLGVSVASLANHPQSQSQHGSSSSFAQAQSRSAPDGFPGHGQSPRSSVPLHQSASAGSSLGGVITSPGRERVGDRERERERERRRSSNAASQHGHSLSHPSTMPSPGPGSAFGAPAIGDASVGMGRSRSDHRLDPRAERERDREMHEAMMREREQRERERMMGAENPNLNPNLNPPPSSSSAAGGQGQGHLHVHPHVHVHPHTHPHTHPAHQHQHVHPHTHQHAHPHAAHQHQHVQQGPGQHVHHAHVHVHPAGMSPVRERDRDGSGRDSKASVRDRERERERDGRDRERDPYPAGSVGRERDRDMHMHPSSSFPPSSDPAPPPNANSRLRAERDRDRERERSQSQLYRQSEHAHALAQQHALGHPLAQSDLVPDFPPTQSQQRGRHAQQIPPPNPNDLPPAQNPYEPQVGFLSHVAMYQQQQHHQAQRVQQQQVQQQARMQAERERDREQKMLMQQQQQVEQQRQAEMRHAQVQAAMQQQQQQIQQQQQLAPPRVSAREREKEQREREREVLEREREMRAREMEREREREHLLALTSQHPGTATSARYESLMLPRSMSPLPPTVSVVYESSVPPEAEAGAEGRRCLDLGTFVHPNTPLPLPVMSVMPSWVTPSTAAGAVAAAEGGSPHVALDGDAPPLPAPVALHAHAALPLTKTEKERRRERDGRRSVASAIPSPIPQTLFAPSPHHGLTSSSQDEGAALLVPAPSYAFTLLIPSGNLLDKIPSEGACELWGTQANAPAFSSSSSSTKAGSVPLANKASSSSARGSGKDTQRRPGDMWEGTLGYTDDSDVRLMVLHAGFVSLADMRSARFGTPTSSTSSTELERTSSGKSFSSRAKKAGDEDPRAPRLVSSGGRRDLAVRLLWRGVKSRFKGSLGPEAGGSVQSAAWGTSHDGGVLEVERVEWIPSGQAHSRHKPNRKARMAQYTSERVRLHLAPSESPAPSSSSHSPIISSLRPLPPTTSAMRSPAASTSSRRSLSTDATAVELDLEDGEAEGGRLSVLMAFGQGADSAKRKRKRALEEDVEEGEVAPSPTSAESPENVDETWQAASFVYDPELVRSTVFPPLILPPPASTTSFVVPPSQTVAGGRKRRKTTEHHASRLDRDSPSSSADVSPIEATSAAPRNAPKRTVYLYGDATTFVLEPDSDVASSPSPRTYTLRSISSSPPSSTILATVLDEADLHFTATGFQYRSKSSEDATMANADAPSESKDLSDVHRLSRWRYVIHSEPAAQTNVDKLSSTKVSSTTSTPRVVAATA